MAEVNDKKLPQEVAKTEGKKTKSSSAKTPNSKVSSNKLELLITIVNRSKAEFYADVLQAFDVNMQMIVKGRGTATVEMLDVLGISDTKKAVIFSVIKEEKIKDALIALDVKFKTIKDGKGIAYTVPLTSIIGVAVYGFLSNNKMTVKEGKNEKV